MLLSIEGRPDRAQAKAVIRAAIESGITLIDSADAYALDDSDIGHNERLIAEALGDLGLRAGEDSPIVVATKGGNTRPDGLWVQDGSPEHLKAACEASLTALGVEQIALYHLHVPDPKVPFADSVGALARLREEGKIGAVGVSNVTLDQLREAEAIVPVSCVQNYGSAWSVGLRKPPVLSYCETRGIVFMAYSPLGGRDRAGALEQGAALSRVAAESGISPQELALAWLVGRGATVVPIPSATRPASVQSSARAATLELDRATRRAATKALRRLPGNKGLVGKVATRVARLFD